MFDDMVLIEFLQTLYVSMLLYCQQYKTNMTNLNKESDLLKRFGVFHKNQRKSCGGGRAGAGREEVDFGRVVAR